MSKNLGLDMHLVYTNAHLTTSHSAYPRCMNTEVVNTVCATLIGKTVHDSPGPCSAWFKGIVLFYFCFNYLEEKPVQILVKET